MFCSTTCQYAKKFLSRIDSVDGISFQMVLYLSLRLEYTIRFSGFRIFSLFVQVFATFRSTFNSFSLSVLQYFNTTTHALVIFSILYNFLSFSNLVSLSSRKKAIICSDLAFLSINKRIGSQCVGYVSTISFFLSRDILFQTTCRFFLFTCGHWNKVFEKSNVLSLSLYRLDFNYMIANVLL